MLLAVAGCAMTPPSPSGPAARLMVWNDLLSRPRPRADREIRYGPAAEQVVDVWLPSGAGPHPVVVMVHGGCWQTEIADRTIMNWIADDLRRRGIAVWNIDYRGVDRPGGGYPGTFADVAKAADSLRDHAAALNLDTTRIVTVGHSAGGHLALWLAARHRLPSGSPFAANPLPVAMAISLGGLQDLELAARPPGSGCGTAIVGRLVDAANRADPYADTSVPRLLPLGVRQILINGREDRIIPTHYAEDYRTRARTSGEAVDVRMLDATGHVELIVPDTQAWAQAVVAIERGLGRTAG